MFSLVYLQRVLEQEFGRKEAMKVLYWQGKFQSIQGISINDKKHGYVKKIPEKIQRMKFIAKQSELTGVGIFELKKIDFEKEHFVITSNSSFAHEYRTFIGKQDKPIDFFMRGQIVASIEYYLGKECLCIQTKCIGMGDQYSEYTVRPVDAWNKEDPLVSDQWVDSFPELKDLAENKKDPYLAYEAKGKEDYS
ncbi:MAG: 4-vinyl reductase [Nanoarchaeota archaeon]|nr:4-vinyl reductase [Nanoarchaeota archaeon]